MSSDPICKLVHEKNAYQERQVAFSAAIQPIQNFVSYARDGSNMVSIHTYASQIRVSSVWVIFRTDLSPKAASAQFSGSTAIVNHNSHNTEPPEVRPASLALPMKSGLLAEKATR